LARVKIPAPNEKSGPLAGHVRKGRVYKSPLAATGVLHVGDWVRDDLPDLLWPVLVLSELGTAEGRHRFLRWQKAVQADLAGNAEPVFIAECLDGRLTSLERLAIQIPEAMAAARTRAEEAALLPEAVAIALDSYPLRPAAWLTNRETTPAGQDEIDLLGRAVLEVLTDGHREGVIKCLWIWSAVQAGTFRSNAETIELLKTYPSDPRTRARADSAVRAMWGARRELALRDNQPHFAEAIKWARVFWEANSMFTRCVRQSEAGADGHDQEEDAMVTGKPAPGEEPPRPGPGPMPADGAQLRRLAMDLLSSYVEALETSPSRLYDHEQQEVVSGLVVRAGRDGT